MRMECGASMERGRILTAENGGYTVASLDRDGIISGALKATDGHSYTVGDTVYFFLFRDGTGRILCPMEGEGGLPSAEGVTF